MKRKHTEKRIYVCQVWRNKDKQVLNLFATFNIIVFVYTAVCVASIRKCDITYICGLFTKSWEDFKL